MARCHNISQVNIVVYFGKKVKPNLKEYQQEKKRSWILVPRHQKLNQFPSALAAALKRKGNMEDAQR